jgi:3-oxoacyl-[acyl-carrier-protein] synthase-3
MRYTKVHIESFGYELPPVVVTTRELEERLAPLYQKLHIPVGQVEHMTGIRERRWWPDGFEVSQGAIAAGRKALEASGLNASDLGMVVYGSVCREYFEPATACRIADGLGVGGRAFVYDISNACLGVLNGVVEIANRIELGQIRAGISIGCETAREINEVMIARMLEAGDMETFIPSLATLTGGSAAVAVVLTDASLSREKRRRLLGGAVRSAPQHHELCTWGMEPASREGHPGRTPLGSVWSRQYSPLHYTDAAAVQKYGVELGSQTFRDFLDTLGWKVGDVDKTICHQVGTAHRETVLKSLGLSSARDFITYPFFGNIGTVALPITLAIAEEREFLDAGDRVGLLGIGSGLNCLMLGVEW